MVYIPVTFHLVTRGYGEGDGLLSYRTQGQLLQQLNQGFMYTGFQFYYNNTHVIYNADMSETFRDDDRSVGVGGGPQHLNVVIASNVYNKGQLSGGYGTFPWDAWEGREADRIVIPVSNLGLFQGDAINLNSIVHEVGHWLGLLHVDQFGCEDASLHSDLVTDTDMAGAVPASSRLHVSAGQCDVPFHSRCQLPGRQRREAYPAYNYMSYVCQGEFTQGQVKRMRDMWKYRTVQPGYDPGYLPDKFSVYVG
jgi:hypothetical protein